MNRSHAAPAFRTATAENGRTARVHPRPARAGGSTNARNPRQPTEPDWLMPAGEVATTLGVDVTTLRRWHASHAGPPTSDSTDPVPTYSHTELEAWCDRLGEGNGPCGSTVPTTCHATCTRVRYTGVVSVPRVLTLGELARAPG